MEIETPDSGPEDFGTTVQKRIKESTDHLKDWLKEASELYDFVAGHQFTEEELSYLEENQRAGVVFNRMGPIIDSVVGHQINNRTEARFFPRENGDAHVSDILTGAAQWADDGCDAEDEISDSFWDAIITGMGWTETYMSYDEEPEGRLVSAERVPVDEMRYDPLAKKRNVTDARWMARLRWVDRTEAEQRWPAIRKIGASGEHGDANPVVDQPHDATKAFLYENDQVADWYDRAADEVLISQYQWWDRKPVYLIGDPSTGKLIELSEAKFMRLMDDLGDGTAIIKGSVDGLPIRYVRQLKKTFMQAFLLGPHVLDKGPNTCPMGFTFHAITGKRDFTKRTWYGLGRGMKDPQRWGNKFFSDIQDILASNRRGGAFVEESAFVDPAKAERDWNASSPLILVRDGALAAGRILERNQVQYPVGLDRLLQFAVQSIPDVTGVNMELMGLVDRNQPGILEAQRKRAAMTILAIFFSALRRYQKERGRTVMYFIQHYLSDGRLIRIMGENGDPKYVPLVREEGISEYDIIVDEAPTSTNQKTETFAVIQALLPAFQALGVPPPPDVFKHLPLPAVLADEWRKSIEQARKQQQEQAAKAQAIAEKAAAATTGKDESQAILNQMKAMAEAAKLQIEQMDAITNRVKAISEILERSTPQQEKDDAPGKQ